MSHVLKYRAWHNGEMHYAGFQRFLGSYGVQFVQFDEVPDSLMSFTGFTHKGVDIYDKDILRFTYPVQSQKPKPKKQPYNDMVVSWNAKRGQWCAYWKNGGGELQYQSLASALDENHEIVGNAYENKELIT